MWSKSAPSVEILARATILSNHTTKLFEENMLSNVFRTKVSNAIDPSIRNIPIKFHTLTTDLIADVF